MSLFFAVLGLVIGSFLNVVIFRVPAGLSIVTPPSRCGSCGRRLGAVDLVPVASYVFLRGRCRTCGARISVRYPLVESFTGILFVLTYLVFGLTWSLVPALAWVSLFLVITLIDLDHQIIPDGLVLFGFVVAVLEKVVQVGFLGMKLNVGSDLVGFLVGGGLFFLIAVLSKGGMGGGDIKLMALLGFVFGFPEVLLLAALAFIGGAVVSVFLLASGLKSRKEPIPFGPFLAASAVAMLLAGQPIMTWYLHYFGL